MAHSCNLDNQMAGKYFVNHTIIADANTVSGFTSV